MKRTLIIHNLPVARINPVLAAMLVGIAIDLRPELYQWTIEPVEVTQGDFYYVHNDDLRQVLMSQPGAEAAHGLYDFLPVGRATSIERGCCTLISKVAPLTAKAAA
ncbi:MAG: hypothetical protein ACEQSB_01285 [Undibacterium sp.]